MKEKNTLLPRERLLKFGPDALSDAELLAVLLRTGTKGTPVQKMANGVLERFHGSLQELCEASIGELCEVSGMGEAKSLELCAAFALARRLARQRMVLRPDMSSPKLTAMYMRDIIQDSRQEGFHALLVDSKLQLIRHELVSLGLVDRSLVHAREVFRCAIREAASGIILCHNHPSGHVIPSGKDIEVTKNLCQAGEIIGIKILDHLIVGGNVDGTEGEYFSFAEKGLMPPPTKAKMP